MLCAGANSLMLHLHAFKLQRVKCMRSEEDAVAVAGKGG